MDTSIAIQRLVDRFDRFEKKQEGKQKKAETWIKASDVFRLTVWKTPQQLQYARKLGHITQKKENGIWYLWESVKQIHREANIVTNS